MTLWFYFALAPACSACLYHGAVPVVPRFDLVFKNSIDLVIAQGVVYARHFSASGSDNRAKLICLAGNTPLLNSDLRKRLSNSQETSSDQFQNGD
jgi:hypothetical protein